MGDGKERNGKWWKGRELELGKKTEKKVTTLKERLGTERNRGVVEKKGVGIWVGTGR